MYVLKNLSEHTWIFYIFTSIHECKKIFTYVSEHPNYKIGCEFFLMKKFTGCERRIHLLIYLLSPTGCTVMVLAAPGCSSWPGGVQPTVHAKNTWIFFLSKSFHNFEVFLILWSHILIKRFYRVALGSIKSKNSYLPQERRNRLLKSVTKISC